MTTPPSASLLVDRRLGLITGLRRTPVPPELPPAFVHITADVADVFRFCGWPADRTATGMAFSDETAASVAAVGEAVERYCGNVIPPQLVRGSAESLCADGWTPIDPSRLCLYSSRQYDADGFPFVPFTRDLEIEWVKGTDLRTGEAVLLPAPLCYLNYYTGWRRQEPPITFIQYAGIAAGASLEEAEAAALEEIVERDAVTIWWLGDGPTIELTLEESPAIRAAVAIPEPTPVTLRFYGLPSPFDVPVVAALLVDEEHEVVTLGTACRLDAETAARKAAAEALSLWFYADGLLTPDGDIWRAAAAGMLNPEALKPFRADRRYADSYRPDYRDVIDLSCHAQLYLDPRMRRFVARLTATTERRPLASIVPVGGNRRETLLARLSGHGLSAYSADLTTADVRRAGWAVARVIVPGLYGNFPAAFPLLGGRRLYEEPVRLGWRSSPLTEDDLFLAPLPHT